LKQLLTSLYLTVLTDRFLQWRKLLFSMR